MMFVSNGEMINSILCRQPCPLHPSTFAQPSLPEDDIMPLKVVSPPLAFVDAAIREPNAI